MHLSFAGCTMKIIYTRKGEEILVDDEDYERLNSFVWHVNGGGYAARGIKRPDSGRKAIQLMHRELMGLTPLDKVVVDHINCDKLDNRRLNLRICTRQQNLCNRGSTRQNSTGFKGVYYHPSKGKWSALIKVNYKSHYLGIFDTPEEAHEAYKCAAARLHGEFANAGSTQR